MSTAELMDTFRRRGIALSADAGRLMVRPATALTPDDREAIRRYLPELVAVLAVAGTPSPCPETAVASNSWNRATAHQLMFDADTLVERLGVDGRHPVISTAAARVTDAHMAHDLLALRRALTEFETAVRGAHLNSGRG